MSDARGGLVMFTLLSRNHLSDGVYDLVADVETWIPQGSYRLEPAVHHQSAGAALSPSADLAFVRVIPLAGGPTLECQEILETVLTRQETAQAQDRIYTAATP